MKWISVKERLPQTGANVWVVWSGTVQTVAYHRMGLGFACADGYQWEPAEHIDGDPIPDGEVTHWQSLPAPPPRRAMSLLRNANEPLPKGCYCKPGHCMAPVVMGRQTPCRDPEKAAPPTR